MQDLNPLVEKAKQMQVKAGMTDGRFAVEVLHLSPGYWSKIKSGNAKGKGGKFVQAMFTRFPDLAFSLPPSIPIGVNNTND